MENIITKLLEQIKDSFEFFYDKPWHFLFVGIAILLIYLFYYSSVYLILVSIVLIVFSLITIIERIVNICKFKKHIKQSYSDLIDIEKEIIDYCISKRTLTYHKDLYAEDDYTMAIYSLVGKGFGQNINYGGDFLLFQEVYEQILKIKAK